MRVVPHPSRPSRLRGQATRLPFRSSDRSRVSRSGESTPVTVEEGKQPNEERKGGISLLERPSPASRGL